MGIRTSLFLTSAVVTAAFAAAIVGQHRQAVRLGTELESLRARQEQAQVLEREHRRLEDDLEKLGNLAQLRRAYQQSSALRPQIEKLKLQARNLAFISASKDHPIEPVWPKDAQVLPADEWQFAGSKTPGSTLESVLWAARGGDIDRLAGLIDFRPGDRERADQLLAGLTPESRAQYGSAENLVATLVAANMPTDYAAAASYNERESQDQAWLTLRVEQASGRQQDLNFMFHAGQDGWQLDVPGNVIAEFEQQLKSR